MANTLMFNETVKREFINTYKKESTKEFAEKTFTYSYPFELSHGDVGSVSKEFLLDFLTEKGMLKSACTYRSIFNKYREWYANKNSLIPPISININDLRDRIDEDGLNNIINRDDLYLLANKAMSKQWMIPIILAFEGLGGNGNIEIRNLERSDVDFDNAIISIKNSKKPRNIKVQQATLNILKLAQEEKEVQYVRDGKKHLNVLVDNNFVIRKANNTWKEKANEPVKKAVIDKRFQDINEEFSKETKGFNFISGRINYSGIYYYLRCYEVLFSTEINNEFVLKVLKRYAHSCTNIFEVKNKYSQYRERFIYNSETIQNDVKDIINDINKIQLTKEEIEYLKKYSRKEKLLPNKDDYIEEKPEEERFKSSWAEGEDERHKERGYKGERYVYETLLKKFDNDEKNLINPKDIYGFDIYIRDPETKIEVKTCSSEKPVIYITKKELEIARNNKEIYYLIIVLVDSKDEIISCKVMDKSNEIWAYTENYLGCQTNVLEKFNIDIPKIKVNLNSDFLEHQLCFEEFLNRFEYLRNLEKII